MADADRSVPRIGTLLAALLALLLVAGLGMSAIALERPTGQAAGRVTTEDGGKPLVGARVTVTGPVTRHLLTGPDGTFRFANLPVGTYYISAKQKRYDSQFQENGLTIQEGRGVENLDFKLVATAPSLDITNQQRVFTPKEPVRILVRGTNAPELAVSLYRLDLAKAMAIDPKLKLLHHPKVADLRAQGLIQSVRSWKQPIPREVVDDDDWYFKPVQIPDVGEGAYLVAMSETPEAVPEDKEPEDQLDAAYWFDVSRLALVTKRSDRQLLVYAADLVAKKPVPGVKLDLFDELKRQGGGVTDQDGLARLDSARVYGRGWVLGMANGSPAVVDAGWTNDEDVNRIYAYTERPVYRPGQRVFYKATVRQRGQARYGLAGGESATVEIRDGDGNSLEKHDVTLSAASSLDGSFDLPADAHLGEYSVDIQVGRSNESASFKVADYRKPEYKVEVSTDKPRYVQGSKAKVHILSSYYFGAPVPGAKLAVTVYSAPAYVEHDPDEDFFSGYTGDSGEEPVWGFGDVIQQVDGACDAQGKFDLDVDLPVAASAGEDGWVGDRVFTVAVEAVDQSGKPVKGHQSFPVNQGLLKLAVDTDNYLYVAKHPVRLELKAHDYDGKPAATDVAIKVVRQVSVRKTDADGDETWESHEEPAWSGSAKTDAHGVGQLDLPVQPPGNYRIQATLHDASGNAVEAQTWAWVAAGDEPYAAEAGSSPSGSLKVVLDHKVFKPGQTARALVVSPVANATALVTVEGTKLHEVHVVHLNGTTGLVSIPVTHDYEPNAYVAACIVNGKEFLETSRSLNVTPADKFLQVKVTTDKPRYQPGDKATYTVETRDYQGRPVSAEVALGVVDQAIYAIQPDETPDMRAFFHGPRYNSVRTAYSFAEDYSGGLDKFAPDPRVRAKFEDTAAWFPALRTGQNGQASVTVTLPDNLTTWVATAHAATDDTRVGSASSTAIATKDLLVRLETPRFLVEGDHALISAITHNYTQAVQQVQVALGLTGLATRAPAAQLAAIQPGDAKRATWEVTADKPGDVTAKVVSRGQTAADAMQLTLPVEANATPEFQSFAGSVEANKPGFASFELPADMVPGSSQASLRLHTSPLPSILAAVDYLHHYHYGCVEQTMSRFLPDVAIKPRLDAAHQAYGDRFADQDKRMKDGIDRLVGMQHGDGGWGWWEHDDTEVEMTSYVLYGLSEAKAAGYKVPGEAVRKGIDNLQRGLPRVKKDLFTRDSVRRGAGADTRAFALFALARWGKAPAAEVDRLWADRADMSNFGLAQLGLTLGTLQDQRRFQALELLRTAASQSETQAHWDANAREFAWQDNTTETTAYALRALLAIAPDDALVGRTVRWLESRNGRGYWDSTKDSGAAAIALAEQLRQHPPAAPQTAGFVVKLDGNPIEVAPDAPELTLGAMAPGRHQLDLTLANGSVDFSGGVAYQLRAGKLQASPGRGLTVGRDYFLLPADVYAKARGQGTWGQFYDEKVVKTLPKVGGTVKSGERVLVRVSIGTDRPLRYMALEDPLPAGCEVLDDAPTSWGYWWDHQEYRDDRAAFFFNELPTGARTMYYVMRPTTPGTFHVLPTTAWAMYAPDVRSRGASGELTITE